MTTTPDDDDDDSPLSAANIVEFNVTIVVYRWHLGFQLNFSINDKGLV